MAQERPLTPEKQLLRLIETSSTRPVSVGTQAAKYHSLSFFSLGALRGRLSFFKDALLKWLRSGKSQHLDIGIINRVLQALLVVLACYLAVDLARSAVRLTKTPDFGFQDRDTAGKKTSVLEGAALVEKRASDYLDKISERDIFKMGAKKANAGTSQKAPTVAIMEATQNLKLVGISWSGDPDAIIEDTKVLRTFFVKRNSMIGNVKVQAILKDKVVLTYNGEEIELK